MCCLTGQYHSAKKGWYSWLYSPAGTIKTNQNNFFCDSNIILTPPPPHLSILKLGSNFILGLNFIFFCFKLIIIITIPKNLPTLAGTNLGCSGDSPQLSTAPITPLPVGEIYEVNKILALLCAAH